MYTPEDQLLAPEGTYRYLDTDVEVLSYRTGNQLCIVLNKNGVCAYRATIVNAFAPGTPNSMPPTKPEEDTFVLRYLRSN